MFSVVGGYILGSEDWSLSVVAVPEFERVLSASSGHCQLTGGTGSHAAHLLPHLSLQLQNTHQPKVCVCVCV